MNTNDNNLKKHIVGIGSVCAETGHAQMTAYALGSCIALCLYDYKKNIGSMAHILLPASNYTGHENSDIDISTKYADHALCDALNKMLELGSDIKRIKAAIIGGATMFPHGNMKILNIGKMNIASVTSELYKNGIPILYNETGGTKSRTVLFKFLGNSFEEQISINLSGKNQSLNT